MVNRFGEGDIRHCFADISKIQRKLGFCPTVSLEEGLRDLIPYLEDQIVRDRVDQATEELARRKLVW